MAEAGEMTAERLRRLLDYVAADPSNQHLLSEAAQAAIDARQPDQAIDLLDRLGGLRELDDRELNLLGLAALHLQDHQRAGAIYQSLLDRGVDHSAIRFNLSWALMKRGDAEAALAVLDEATAEALPQAAMLKVQLLHNRGDMEAAEAAARRGLDRHETDAGLLAAVSVLAIDIDDPDLAERCARAAGDHPDALATLGTLALDAEDPHEARAYFDRALAIRADIPRARIGRGLSLLADGDPAQAAGELDRGAELFGDHLGSFIAAGWAYFIASELPAARRRFERALELDATFAESHGSLAVLDLIEGRPTEAERAMAIAFRLDRQCYSAALAQVLLRAGSGDQEGARRIFEKAIHSPVDERGRTIAQAMARMGRRGSV